ncbi:acyl-CoA dehydrogenase [Arhodomonas sp. SL1]|uniref:acyl-CoA dehydrogenase n=1 Tax=Arhodomonas sp. SL1 TaxID=3425691 RepID=UPI003F885B71
MDAVFWLLTLLAVIAVLGFRRYPLWINTATVTAWLLAFSVAGDHAAIWDALLWVVLLAVAVPLNLPGLRRRLLTDRLFEWFRGVMPEISETERAALDAGTVWWDAALFTGRPDWDELLAHPGPRLTEEERVFLDGPCETLCRMVSDWEITHERLDLPPEAWRYIREQGFFGLIIPREYGGKGFSALAHSAVTMKLASRSADLGSTVMVPNSLGPAELLMRYGTDAQKDHYLPRLAHGEEVPCFALTAPTAGSDAGAIPDTGVVCYGEHQGERVLGLRVNWDKRYITLAPVATVLGLAFKAHDPDHLLGDEESLGITLALIPTDTPGVETGRRHFPLNSAFMNGPTRGRDVFVPLDWIIGGRERLGDGWRMLMNCLSVGRSISLPSAGTAQSKFTAWTTGGYARVREQFGVPIGEFEGVQEALARIAGNAYVTDAARVLTASAIDAGEEPAVVSAIVKYHLTERARQSITDAMDIHGGKGICLGPRNYLGRLWQTSPIAITVEGSNILTRNMMIFGQGAIRCHPYVLREILATANPDREAGRAEFDALVVAHAGFGASNALRSLLLGLSGGRLAAAPASAAAQARAYYRQLSRYAAAFALTADAAMLTLGGGLKRRERISARLGDMLSCLYLASAALKRYEDDACPEADLPLLRWVLEEALFTLQERLDTVLGNFPSRPLAVLLRALVFPLGRHRRGPSDALGAQVARTLMEPGASRDRLLAGIHISDDREDPTGAVEHALRLTIEAAPIEQRLRRAVRRGELSVRWDEDEVEVAVAAGLLDGDEAERIRAARTARLRVIAVDDYDAAELVASAG